MQKINLLDYDKHTLERFFIEIDEKPFRASQVLGWIHQKGVLDFDQMTDLGQALRTKLKHIAIVQPPPILSEQKASDGTRKWLFSSHNNSAIETVYIPEENRATLCISSQVGCALNCRFCHTAQQGFQGNLKPFEIIGQLWTVVHLLRKESGGIKKTPITNVVFMGMGEPLLNFDAVLTALHLMQDDLAYGLSKKRITVSTSGVVPTMHTLIEKTNVSLAVSLHAPFDDLRTEIMPINKKYNLKQLMAVCREWTQKNKRRKVTMEYVMLAGVNDQLEHAEALVKLLKTVPSKVNLIPFNPFAGTQYHCSSWPQIRAFQEVLNRHKIVTIVRKTRGEDIDAACGQLAGRVLDKTKRSQSYKAQRQYHLPIIVNSDPVQDSAALQD